MNALREMLGTTVLPFLRLCGVMTSVAVVVMGLTEGADALWPEAAWVYVAWVALELVNLAVREPG